MDKVWLIGRAAVNDFDLDYVLVDQRTKSIACDINQFPGRGELLDRSVVADQRQDSRDFIGEVSHVLGAALMQERRPAEAEAVYRDSLKTYRADGWALYGLAQALDAQGRRAEASAVRKDFKQALMFADVTLTSSRF